MTQEVSADRGTLTYTYDAAGNVTRRTDGLGRVTEYEWDALNRPTAIKYRPSVGAVISETVTYVWDSGPACYFGQGRVCRVIDAGGTTDYLYSQSGHLEREQRTESGVIAQTEFWKDGQGRTLNSTDAANLRAFPTRIGGGEIFWLDFEDGRSGDWLSLSVTLHTYDAAGQVTGAVFGSWGAELGYFRAYDLDGHLTESVLASYVPAMDASWVSIYAPVGGSVEVAVTMGPDEVLGTLLMCRDPYLHPSCDGEHRLGEVAVEGGGTYALRSLDSLPTGVYSVGVRFLPGPPFAEHDLIPRPIFIGIPPTSLVDDLLH